MAAGVVQRNRQRNTVGIGYSRDVSTFVLLEALRILVIVTHTSDAFEMIGGTLANHTECDDEMIITVLNKEDMAKNFQLADEISKGRTVNNKEKQIWIM
jgi:hypothetical protein